MRELNFLGKVHRHMYQETDVNFDGDRITYRVDRESPVVRN